MHDALPAIAVLLVTGIGCQWLAWRLRIPAILFLLATGVVGGPVLGWFQPDLLFGDLLFPFVSLSVALILFEGGLTLEFHQIAGLQPVIRRLITVGLAVTWLLTALTTRFLLGLGWDISLLFGALIVVTGPTVILPMLRAIRPTANIAHVLRWEGILIDPIGAILAVLVFEVILAGPSALTGHIALILLRMLLIGLVFGWIAGQVLGELMRRHWLPEFLHNVFGLALVCGVFALSDLLQPESGLLAVTVMGMRLANMSGVDTDTLLDFKESLSILLISLLFIVLAARIQPTALLNLGWAALGVFGVVQFLARPISVYLAAMGSRLSWPERHLLSWVAPRGIVAAAISALFALRLEQIGHPEAGSLVPLTFLVIVGTVVLQGITSGPLARALGVAEAVPKGVLIVGSGRVARAIGLALQEQGFRPQLLDTYWEGISKARMEGLSTYFGNPLSDHADRYIDLIGVGAMLALTPSTEQNDLATLHFRLEIGRDAVFSVRTSPERQETERRGLSLRRRARRLFAEEVTYRKLESLLAQGWEIRSTELTDSFDWEAYRQKWGDRAIPLFGVGPRGGLYPVTDGNGFAPDDGWRVLALVKVPDSQAEEV